MRYKAGIETRDRILEATRSSIAEVGLQGTTIKGICERAGVLLQPVRLEGTGRHHCRSRGHRRNRPRPGASRPGHSRRPRRGLYHLHRRPERPRPGIHRHRRSRLRQQRRTSRPRPQTPRRQGRPVRCGDEPGTPGTEWRSLDEKGGNARLGVERNRPPLRTG